MYQLIKNHKNYSLHFMVVILGLTGVFGKLISLESLNLVWYRMLIAFLSLFIYLLIRKEAFSISKKDFFGLLGVGVLVTLHWLFFFKSIKVSTISVAVVCLATSSLFSALIEPIFFKRKILIYELVMGLVVIIALVYVLGTDSKYILGYIYGVMAAFFGTMFTLFN
ncbi:MAG: EamA family transporter, partial [Flavobacteriales bacterium]